MNPEIEMQYKIDELEVLRKDIEDLDAMLRDNIDHYGGPHRPMIGFKSAKEAKKVLLKYMDELTGEINILKGAEVGGGDGKQEEGSAEGEKEGFQDSAGRDPGDIGGAESYDETDREMRQMGSEFSYGKIYEKAGQAEQEAGDVK